MNKRYTNEEIITAYEKTGSVWRAAKELGCCGQSVWERLRGLGYRMSRPAWTEEEVGELRSLYEHSIPLAEIGRRLNRTYAAVACKLNELGVKGANKRKDRASPPRGKGYDKKNILKIMKTLNQDPSIKVTNLAKKEGLGVTWMVEKLREYAPSDFALYMQAHHGPDKTKQCPECGEDFYPANGKQRFCSSKCCIRWNSDQSYFNGLRSTAIGMAEGVCQLCGKTNHKKRLHAHHVIGKRFDPENKCMVALCPGCHQLVGLASKNKNLVSSPKAWEAFATLAWFEANGEKARDSPDGAYLYVEVCMEEGNDNG